ncbi:hypothetical protein GUJ93_ZPchr0002g25348 [Zizania palustris]|uniref:Uncharacterized protein n=1 Tax=Zizania palustris TaxID=103762 RepID=A0A8J5S1D3_ZIZPA|nr:hypothetical protein GUJ93_ZPchr0002g25348 [Zizania palustris]
MADEGELLAGGESIRPPPLEDAGLEDCALPPEAIAEAFSLAAKAVSSRLAHLSFSDEDEDDGDRSLTPRVRYGGGCVDESGTTCGAIPDALVGTGCDRNGCADEVVVVGGGSEVVVGGSGDDEDRVVVLGDEQDQKLDPDKGCVEGIRETENESLDWGGMEGNGDEEKEEEEVAMEKAILVQDFS